ncbi:MAG: FGGY-family carbohydrate kinase [Caldilineaceae bacterium]
MVIGGGDGSCAGIGAGVVEPGAAYCVIGTSAWISVSTLEPVPDPQQRTMTFHHVHPERYAPMGVMQLAGGAREWGWQALGDGELDLDQAAAARTSRGRRPHLFALSHGRRNVVEPGRAAFVGLGVQHDKATMARAVLEGVGFGLGQILDSLREQVDGIDAIRLIGGGGRSAFLANRTTSLNSGPSAGLTGEATSAGAAVAWRGRGPLIGPLPNGT